jgi:hypothetical protein
MMRFIPQPFSPHGHRWLQADAFVRALLGHEKSQPEAGILAPITTRLHAMALRGPYFVVEVPVALLGIGESCNVTFSALLCERLDCFLAQR